jgi:predicted HTH domain antitoxin
MKNLEMRLNIMSERLSIVIPIQLKSRIDELKNKLNLDQSSLIRILLNEAISEKEIEISISEYKKGRITLGEAVLFSKTDYWTYLSLLRDRKIPVNIDEEDHEREIQKVHKKDYKKFIS